MGPLKEIQEKLLRVGYFEIIVEALFVDSRELLALPPALVLSCGQYAMDLELLLIETFLS